MKIFFSKLRVLKIGYDSRTQQKSRIGPEEDKTNVKILPESFTNTRFISIPLLGVIHKSKTLL